MTSSTVPVSQALPDLAALRAPVQRGDTRAEGWRRRQLQAVATLVEEHEDEILAALHQDLGKPELEGMVEILALRQELKLCRRQLRRWMRPRPVPVPLAQRPGKAEVIREPLGCVLIIGPWNYPFHLTLQPLISALAAGNTAVVKPSEQSPATSSLIARLLPSYFPQDVVQVVEGEGPVAAALVDQGYDHIFFTGSGAIGARVLAGAAPHLTPVTLELGGKSPAVVLEGADLAVTARRLIWGKGLNAGQTCIAPDHLLVQASIREPLLAALAQARLELYGEQPLQSPDLAHLIHGRHFQRLSALLEGARQSGQVLIGGESDADTLRMAPTVIQVDRDDDPLMEDELFGPLLPMICVDNLAEAITRIRRQPKPLALYLFGGEAQDRAMLLQGTSSGGVCFNDVVMQVGVPELPFGGVGASGMGAYHGEAGFRTFSHERAVLKRSFALDARLRYPPYAISRGLIKRLLG
jgi:aldehyde dehydrogenase (NAD+)